MLRRAMVACRWMFLTLAAGLSWQAQARPDEPAAARWIPADAAIYAEIVAPETLLDRANSKTFQSVVAALPGYAKAEKDGKLKQFHDVLAFVANALETTPDKGIRDLTGGGIVLAVEGENKLYLIVTPKEPAFLDRAHAKLVELARADATKKGTPDPISESELRGVKTFSVNAAEAHAIVDGRLIIASGRDMLKTVIDRIKDKPGGASLADNADWKANRAALDKEAVAWSFVRLDRLRELDPKKFASKDPVNPGLIILFGPWVEAAQKSPWTALSVRWTEDQLGAALTVPPPPGGGYSKAVSRYLPGKGEGAPALVAPRGTILSLGLWRDLSAIWEIRTDLFPPEVLQGFAQLDTFAGQFFGGRDFGTGVLGSLSHNWRLVVARQEEKDLDAIPDLKLPAFALVVDLKPDDEEFSQRLKAAFQTFIGLANVGAAQNQAPPLMLGSETVDGVTIATSRYSPPKNPKKDEPISQRFNFSPSSAQVGNTFILGSSVGVTRELVRAVKNPGKASDATLNVEARGDELAKLIDENRERLITQNMLEKGNDRAKAEEAIGLLSRLVKYLGQGSLQVRDHGDGLKVNLDFALGSK
jgi:hypothetical protein